jgi:hypothetical protein
VIGVGFFNRSRGMPRAEARLLAMEDERSLAVALGGRARRGGDGNASCPPVDASDVACDDDELPLDTASDFNCALAASAAVSTFGAGFSCRDLRMCPRCRCCCSSRFKIRTASLSVVPCAAVANSAAARSCSSLAATGFDLFVSRRAFRT